MPSGPLTTDAACNAWYATYHGDQQALVIRRTTEAFTRHRFYLWSGAPPAPLISGAGQKAEMIGCPIGGTSGLLASTTDIAYPLLHGFVVLVEAGAAFAAGASLQSDASGRAITQTTGTALLRALEAASAAGDVCYAVCL